MLATKELISTTFQLPLYLAAAGVHWVLSYSFDQVQRWMVSDGNRVRPARNGSV